MMEKIKEKFYEIFRIKKDNREKVVSVSANADEEKIAKKQVTEENKILKNILIGCLIAIIILVFFVLFFYSINRFEHREVKFTIDTKTMRGKVLYKTSFPLYSEDNKHVADYNFFIRNDPRKLENIPFDGELVLLENMVINSTESFNCDGDGLIAVANLLNPLRVLDVNVIKDENATCDEDGKYMFVQIQNGNTTGIEQFGPACYNLNVNNCEILDVTERFMVEIFVKVGSGL